MKKALADALEKRGYETLTPVQEEVNKPELIGADLLVSAQTGSGKTVGFGLAIAPTLMGEAEVLPQAGPPLALVIAPTRELAMQVKRELAWLYEGANVTMASCVGGMDMRDERRALQRGAHIVVATPGRLRDHIMRSSIDLSEIRAVVLDEADEMLDLGFREDLEFILGEAPAERQTLMFSATVPAEIARLAKSYQKDAVRVQTASKGAQHADIEYRALSVSPRDAENAIINVLRYYEAPNAIVFGNTRAMVNRLTTRLSNRGFSVVSLSGELSQSERTHALQAMRDGRARVCVATDVAARGIDLPNLDLVVHAELPSNHETLLHRSGRTGRAGRKGVSALIVPPVARKKAQRILGWAKLKAEWGAAPSSDEVKARDEERMMADAAWLEAISEDEQPAVEKLTAAFSPEQIAAAYLRLYHSRSSAPEELGAAPTGNEKPEPRAAFGPSVWFSVAGGRAANAEPRRLLPMLCKVGGLTKDDIGAIRIQQDASFVEIKESSVAGFLKSVGSDMTVEDGAALVRLANPPSFDKSPRPAPGGKPYKGKASDKPDWKAKERKPDPQAPSEAAKSAPTPGTTKPVDWNDDPAPRIKKPKPADKKPHGGKSAGKPSGAKPKYEGKPKGKPQDKPYRKPEGSATEPRSDKKPRTAKAETRSDAASPSVSLRKSPGGAKRREHPEGTVLAKHPKGTTGKPNSKKNKARALAAKSGAGKTGGKAKGGDVPPKRRKP